MTTSTGVKQREDGKLQEGEERNEGVCREGWQVGPAKCRPAS